ncbi:hypothetical protein K443DRAFT_541085 [Laccaria amethystina LaAM-08-1]|uniref:Uncharacterized protein n=1 Tax=Laccaria amethystina LaAM-08-1 TaxID=1095629 RepID=A0A0C9WH41_9AGAR|nr:hypothetical protein K443DRAFT_541085 [Laccaria amethystina LaAM-08-1]
MDSFLPHQKLGGREKEKGREVAALLWLKLNGSSKAPFGVRLSFFDGIFSPVTANISTYRGENILRVF